VHEYFKIRNVPEITKGSISQNGKYFQPFELIEPFERIELLKPHKPLKLHKPHKPDTDFLTF